jgi:hypothetical protein
MKAIKKRHLEQEAELEVHRKQMKEMSDANKELRHFIKT